MIRVIGFDGDDTLWHNESLFALTQAKFYDLLRPYTSGQDLEERLFATEMRNLRLFGYGVKSFMLSMIETALEVSDGRVTGTEIQTIIDSGKALLDHPVELLDGVRETIAALDGQYDLLLITKGDLFHQESRIAGSGLGEFFDGIEIVSEKDPPTYDRILRRHGIAPGEFLMVGNSVRSDILPVVELGARAIHIPYHITWQHEVVAHDSSARDGYWELTSVTELPGKLREIEGG
jgi:putative hydrolase of the HAD superfamily